MFTPNPLNHEDGCNKYSIEKMGLGVYGFKYLCERARPSSNSGKLVFIGWDLRLSFGKRKSLKF